MKNSIGGDLTGCCDHPSIYGVLYTQLNLEYRVDENLNYIKPRLPTEEAICTGYQLFSLPYPRCLEESAMCSGLASEPCVPDSRLMIAQRTLLHTICS